MVASGNVGVGGVNLARWYEFNAPAAGTPSPDTAMHYNTLQGYDEPCASN